MKSDREGEAPAEPCLRVREMSGKKSNVLGSEPNNVARASSARKHPVHGVLVKANEPIIVFLTVCTRDRQPWLAVPEVHTLLCSVWTDASAWLVGRYIIMPDHIHLFAAPGSMENGKRLSGSFALPSTPGPTRKSKRLSGNLALPIPFDNWVRYWKSQFSKRHRNPSRRWQTDHWDTRLRRLESYSSKWSYVRNNPVRHGLVECVEDWPFQGEIHELLW
jgi:putative transposase